MIVGQQFGDYLVLRHLGSGGMADVYLAVQSSLDRQVAIKILKPELADDESYLRRFANEARSVASLSHQNIVQVFEVGERDGRHYIAQEYVAGRNLKQHLLRETALPVAEALSILKAVTSALDRASETGIIHRDIKPENILLGDDGEVKVADFGLAQRDHRHRELELTQVGMTVGTPLYMSPEQIQSGKVDFRTDMYSLGVTAYHMLAGYVPFDGDTPLNIAMKHVNEQARALPDIRPDVPREMSDAIHRMMAKRPDERFESFEQLRSALEPIKVDPKAAAALLSSASRSGTARPLSTTSQQLAETAGGRRRWPRYVAAALVGGALAIGFTVSRGGADPIRRRRGESLPQVERKETAEAQHTYALFMNTDEAWRAVFDYFPPDAEGGGPRQRYYALNAKRQLARLYLQREQFDQAIPICEELSALDATDESLRNFGLAAKTVAHFHLGQTEQAASALSSLEDVRDGIEPALRNELQEIRRALRSD